MKRFLTSICLILALSFSSVTAFAAEPAMVFTENNTTETTVVMPRQQGLWYREYEPFIGLLNAKVSPTKGTELRIWVKSDNAIHVTVYETTILGTYHQIFSTQYGAGERDVSVASSCNGRDYLVQFKNDDGVTYSALIYER